MLKSVGLKTLMVSCCGHPLMEIQTEMLVFLLMLFDSVLDVKRMPSEASVLLVNISANEVSLFKFR
jgi:hypothetical protein